MDATEPRSVRPYLPTTGDARPNGASDRLLDVRRPDATVQPWTSTDSGGLLRQNDPGPLAIAWRDRWTLLAIAIVTGALVYAVSAQMPAVYAAETTIAFPYTSPDVAIAGGDAERSRTLRTEAERIMSVGLLEQAAAALRNPPDIATLQDSVEALPAANADVITVRATAPAAADAAAIADAVAAAYRRQVDWRQQNSIDDLERRAQTLDKRIAKQQKQLSTQLEDATVRADDDPAAAGSDPVVAALRLALEASVSQLSDVQKGMDEVRAQQSTASGGIQVLKPATAPAAPEQPQPVRNAATAALLALMAVTTVRWWRADPEPAVLEDAQAAEALLGVPVVGEIPYLRRPGGPVGVVSGQYPEVVDAYRMVAAAIPVRGSVLVTSARPDESCSDLAVNVGAVLSRDGYRMLLVEGDVQTGRILEPRAEPLPGLTDLIVGEADIEACMLSSNVGVNSRMGLIPWGSGPTGLPRSIRSQLGHAIEEFAVYADVVLVDGPPLASSADGLTLAGHVDSILLVVPAGTAVSDIRRLRTRLDQLDRPVLGVVLQHTTTRHRSRRRRRTVLTSVRWEAPGADLTAQPSGPRA
jgi:Mrp family chromosome partitioning ATPase